MNNERLTTNKKWRNNGRGTKEKDTLGIEPRTFSLQDPPACHEQRTTNEETKNDEQQNRFLLFSDEQKIGLEDFEKFPKNDVRSDGASRRPFQACLPLKLIGLVTSLSYFLCLLWMIEPAI